MQLPSIYSLLVAALALSDTSFAARKPADGVLLSQVKTLTLRKDALTAHRRVSAIPQLKCVGGAGCRHYKVDVMRCKNAGSDYDDENIQWTCTASLPEEFKLGSTDVICEGYDGPQDPYVLKGSCGVEYRLLLTKKGEEKYGGGGGVFDGFKPGGFDPAALLFWAVFLGVAGWIIYSIWLSWQGAPAARRPPRNGNFWGGGWGGGGGGGGGGGNDPLDPPPPYPGKQHTTTPAAEGWRPGFWSGALGGAAAGYMAGNRGNRQQETPRGGGGFFGGGNNNNYGSGWGAGSGSPSRSSSGSSAGSRYESTGFGSTSRR